MNVGITGRKNKGRFQLVVGNLMHKKNIWRSIAGCMTLFVGIGIWMSAYGDFRDDVDQIGIDVSQLEQKK